MIPLNIREVSLRELVDAMAKYADDETFRWFQMSYVGQDGSVQAGDTLRVTMAQVRAELVIQEDGCPTVLPTSPEGSPGPSEKDVGSVPRSS